MTDTILAHRRDIDEQINNRVMLLMELAGHMERQILSNTHANKYTAQLKHRCQQVQTESSSWCCPDIIFVRPLSHCLTPQVPFVVALAVSHRTLVGMK